MSGTDAFQRGSHPRSVCWVPSGTPTPTGPAQWWAAVDGSGYWGYSAHGAVGHPWQALVPLSAMPGASHAEVARYHYVVETDIPPEAEADFNQWYESEHLPGLARVPGTVYARRYKRSQGAPLYLACYDLVTPDAMTSAPWLAVRGTAWSDRVRPLFRNTRRTLYVDRAPLPQL